MINYGVEITTTAYKGGVPVTHKKQVEESMYVHSRQEFFEQILAQLDGLQDYDCIQFKVYADKDTREPSRIVTTREVQL